MTTTQRTVVITGVGAERGIGIATAHRFAREGWGVVGLDLDGETSAKVAAEIGERVRRARPTATSRRRRRGLGDTAWPPSTPCTPPEPADRRRGAEHRRDHLARAVPGNHPGPVEQDLRRQRHRHLPGHQGIPAGHDRQRLRPHREHVLGVRAAGRRRVRQDPYSAAKAAVLGFTRSLARELGPTGITVNAITAGAVDTDIRVGSTEEQEASIDAGIPLGRKATTEKSPPCSLSCPPRMPRTSPGPRWTSTAEATCTNGPAALSPPSGCQRTHHDKDRQ